MDSPRIVILGSGHSGHALAATFSSAGFPTQMVSLSRHRAGIVDVNNFQGITLEHQGHTAFAPVSCTADLDLAVKNADIIFCTVPAFYHDSVIERLANCLCSNQTVFFSSYFGAMKMLQRLTHMPHLENITIVESMSAIHAARVKKFGHVEILSMKDHVPISAYTQSGCHHFIARVQKALPGLIPAENILTTSINNVGPILHVPLMLLNAGRIESDNSSWNLYRDGMTPAVQTYIQQLDCERIIIGEQLAVSTQSVEQIMLDVFYQHQHNQQLSVFEWLRRNNVHASKTIGAPNTINTRYLTEGIYYGLKPLAHIARQLNLATPMIDATIQLANAILPAEANPQTNFDFITAELLYHIAPPAYRRAA